jgi:CRP-like cAMP-binding protein
VEQYLNIIIKGVARKFVMTGKKEVTIQLATEGDFILSEISFTKQNPSLVTIESIEPCIFISIKHAHVEQLYANMPKVEKLGRLVVTDMFLKKDSQDFINLDKTIRERFLDYINSYPHMLQRVPQKYIASFLNIKPETFSRLKHLLKKRSV